MALRKNVVREDDRMEALKKMLILGGRGRRAEEEGAGEEKEGTGHGEER